MKLALVKEKPVFSYVCKGCDGRFQSDRTVTYADLDGEAFKSYYCERCADEIKALTKEGSNA